MSASQQQCSKYTRRLGSLDEAHGVRQLGLLVFDAVACRGRACTAMRGRAAGVAQVVVAAAGPRDVPPLPHGAPPSNFESHPRPAPGSASAASAAQTPSPCSWPSRSCSGTSWKFKASMGGGSVAAWGAGSGLLSWRLRVPLPQPWPGPHVVTATSNDPGCASTSFLRRLRSAWSPVCRRTTRICRGCQPGGSSGQCLRMQARVVYSSTQALRHPQSRTWGHQRSNSLIQLGSTDRGTTTRWGPWQGEGQGGRGVGCTRAAGCAGRGGAQHQRQQAPTHLHLPLKLEVGQQRDGLQRLAQPHLVCGGEAGRQGEGRAVGM